MARATGKRNAWTISLFTLEDDDHILEVGSGPGALIQALTASVPRGFIAGIDASSLMVEQASRRNAQAIRTGQVVIQQGTALDLPFEDAVFDKALSANSVPFWPDQLAGVKEMHRVLKPGALIALVLNLLLFVMPPLILLMSALISVQFLVLACAASASILAVVMRILLILRFTCSQRELMLLLCLLHPVSIMLECLILLNSIRWHYRRTGVVWKGRQYT